MAVLRYRGVVELTLHRGSPARRGSPTPGELTSKAFGAGLLSRRQPDAGTSMRASLLWVFVGLTAVGGLGGVWGRRMTPARPRRRLRLQAYRRLRRSKIGRRPAAVSICRRTIGRRSSICAATPQGTAARIRSRRNRAPSPRHSSRWHTIISPAFPTRRSGRIRSAGAQPAHVRGNLFPRRRRPVPSRPAVSRRRRRAARSDVGRALAQACGRQGSSPGAGGAGPHVVHRRRTAAPRCAAD